MKRKNLPGINKINPMINDSMNRLTIGQMIEVSFNLRISKILPKSLRESRDFTEGFISRGLWENTESKFFSGILIYQR